MKQAPVTLAMLFVILSIYRVGVFVEDVLAGGWLSWVFAIGLAASVFISGYYFRFKETRAAAIVATLLFLPADLFLNLVELIRHTSAMELVQEGANFMGIDEVYLTYTMQAGALLFGTLQTLAAAVLGWMAAGAEKITLFRTRAFMPKITAKFLRIIDNLFPENETQKVYASNTEGIAKRKISEVNSEKRKKTNGERTHKSDLTEAQKAQIANMETAQIVANFGGTLRRAEQWKQAAKEGTL